MGPRSFKTHTHLRGPRGPSPLVGVSYNTHTLYLELGVIGSLELSAGGEMPEPTLLSPKS